MPSRAKTIEDLEKLINWLRRLERAKDDPLGAGEQRNIQRYVKLCFDEISKLNDEVQKSLSDRPIP